MEGSERFCADSREMSRGEGLFESHSVANLSGVVMCVCILGVYFGKQEFGLEKKGECPYVTMTLLVKGGSIVFE